MTNSTQKFKLHDIHFHCFGVNRNYIVGTLKTKFGEMQVREMINFDKEDNAFVVNTDLENKWFNKKIEELEKELEEDEIEKDEIDLYKDIFPEVREKLFLFFTKKSYNLIMKNCWFSMNNPKEITKVSESVRDAILKDRRENEKMEREWEIAFYERENGYKYF